MSVELRAHSPVSDIPSPCLIILSDAMHGFATYARTPGWVVTWLRTEGVVSAKLWLSALVACGATLSCQAATPDPTALEHRWDRRAGVQYRIWRDGAGDDKAFERYMRDVQMLIADRHVGPRIEDDPADLPMLAAAIGPRQWMQGGHQCEPERTDGILLLHVLTDSTYLMRDLVQALTEEPLRAGRCVVARSLLLPGHGTVPADLLDVRHEDWTDTVDYGVRSFAGVAGRVHLVGFSTGGALALQAAYAQARAPYLARVPVASLILLAPAIRPRSGWAQVPWLLGAMDALGLKSWEIRHQDLDFAKYESFPVNAGRQLALLATQVDAKLANEPLPVPMFLALSRNDGTLDSARSLKLFQWQSDVRHRLWLVAGVMARADDPLVRELSLDRDRVQIFDPRTEDGKVLDFAHTALPVAQENSHYGKDRAYANCLHYAVADPKVVSPRQCVCMTLQMRKALPASCQQQPQAAHWRYGEPVGSSDAATGGGVLRRLTFNPLFAHMVRDIRAFLGRIPTP